MEFNPLVDRWWLTWREDKVILRSVILRTLTRGWPDLFQHALRAKRGGGAPIKWESLSPLIGRSRETVYRLKGGEIPISLDLLCGLASLLGVEIAEFLPRDIVDWIRQLTVRVCAGDVEERDALAYATYMRFLPVLGPSPAATKRASPDAGVLDEAVRALREADDSWSDATARVAVERVARCLKIRLAHLRHGSAPP